MPDSEIILYDLAAADDRRFSPFCWRNKLVLLHKGLEFHSKAVGFTEISGIHEGKFKSVPVLKHGDIWLDQSWAITEYLERSFPKKPLFHSLPHKQFATWLTHWVDSCLLPPVFQMIVADIHDLLRPADQAYFRETREKRLGRNLESSRETRDQIRPEFQCQLEPLRRYLRASAFIGGDQPDYGDYVVFSLFLWAGATSKWPLLENDDPVATWKQRMYQHLKIQS